MTSTATQQVVSKAWNLAPVLRDDRLKPAREKPWTDKLWVFDYRTNIHHTLKTKPLKRSDLDEFVESYHAQNHHHRKPTWSDTNPEGRWRSFAFEELTKRDKLNLDIFWLKDKSLEDADSLPEPDVLAEETATTTDLIERAS